MTPVIVLIGNCGSLHSTEAAYRSAYFSLGCQVLSFQQDELMQRGQTWLYDRTMEAGASMLQYDRTHSPTALTPDWTAIWRRLEDEGCKTVGAHLDVYWGIPEREDWIRSGDAQFTVGTLFTADGGSDEQWEAAGVNHRWLPPGCDDRFIPEDVQPVPDLADKIVFVGSSMGYHPIYPMRDELIRWARDKWPTRFVEYGNGTANGPIRGEDLARVYASDCVLLGDSCFAGQRANYWSDRIPETLGRGGFLIHPWLPGLRDRYDGAALATYEAGNFEDLDAQVGAFLANPGERDDYKERGRALVQSRDTYRHRAREVLDIMEIGQ